MACGTGTDVDANADNVALVKRAQRDALSETLRQIDSETSGAAAQVIIAQAIGELDNDLDLLTDADRELVASMAAELGLVAAIEVVPAVAS